MVDPVPQGAVRVDGERDAADGVALAPDDEQVAAEVEVLEVEVNGLGSPEPGPSQERDERGVASRANRGVERQRVEHSAHALGVDVAAALLLGIGDLPLRTEDAEPLALLVCGEQAGVRHLAHKRPHGASGIAKGW